MKIGNIVYNTELVNYTKVPYINYYSQIIDYNKIDNTLPTLFVGWSFMRNSNLRVDSIKNASILEKVILPNKLFWEFSFDENTSSHVIGTNYFTIQVPEYYFNLNYKFIDIDPIYNNIHNINELKNFIPDEIENFYVYKNDIVYFLFENIVYGINLNFYSYIGMNKENILDLIKKHSSRGFVDEIGDIYTEYHKMFPELSFLKRFIVVISS